MMNRSGKTLLLLSAFAMCAVASAAEYKPNEVIVKYKDGSVRTRQVMNTLYKSVDATGVKRFRGIMTGFEQLTLNDSVKVQDAIYELQRDENVEYAQPNYILHAYPTTGMEPSAPSVSDVTAQWGCIFPGIPFPPFCKDKPRDARPTLKTAPADINPPIADPSLSQAYGIAKIGAVEAWTTHKGSKKMIVAVIDTGVDYNHQDLAFNMWRNPNPTQNDVVGFDFVHGDGLPFDDNEHGSHCAGVIGATGGNGIGISGVNQRVSIMALKFLTGQGSGTTADAIRAVDYAIGHGAKVLSNSWGGKGDEDNAALREAIDRAKAKDVLFIAAAGNDGTNNDGNDPSFPAGFDNDNLISVAATDSNDKMAYFSNYGVKTTHLGAPGVNIYSTVPGNKYAKLSGTSMAAPHVAGAAALVWSAHPAWTYKQVKQALLSSVDPIASLNGKTSSGGRLNVLKALLSN